MSEIEITGYGRARSDASLALGRPTSIRACVAVLFDRGGVDGYWMGILRGGKDFDNKRCGALVIAPEGIAYAEPCTTKPKPESGVKLGLRLLRGSKNFKSYTWVARWDELTDLKIDPIVHSHYGAYSCISFTAQGRHMRFGISEGQPSSTACVTAIRHFAGESLPFSDVQSVQPRLDGIYITAAHSVMYPYHLVIFNESTFARFTTSSPNASIERSRSSDPTIDRPIYRRNGNHLLSEEDHEAQKDMVVLPDGRLLYQYVVNQGEDAFWGVATHEYVFVPYSEIGERWGQAPSDTKWPAPDWMPVLTQSGEIVAAELGASQSRAKG